MTTALYTHPIFKKHNNTIKHPECPERIDSIMKAIEKNNLKDLLTFANFNKATKADILLGHDQSYVDHILSLNIKEGAQHSIDGDTSLNEYSVEAALFGLGAINQAVEDVCSNKYKNAFVLARPPGHHAEKASAMGFCLFSNVALAALNSLEKQLAKKVLIIDFDVHHGNGTENVIENHEDIYFFSSFQHPLYPDRPFNKNHPRILNLPLNSGMTGVEYLQIWEDKVRPWMESLDFDLILISAGMDAHRLDPLANLNFEVEDFSELTRKILELARLKCEGRVVSHLEGGYHLEALGDCVAIHLKELLDH
ncbi:MAG: histone deacetylase family protein [Bacteriovoracaceae bacterium]